MVRRGFEVFLNDVVVNVLDASPQQSSPCPAPPPRLPGITSVPVASWVSVWFNADPDLLAGGFMSPPCNQMRLDQLLLTFMLMIFLPTLIRFNGITQS